MRSVGDVDRSCLPTVRLATGAECRATLTSWVSCLFPQINGCRALINMGKGFSAKGVCYDSRAVQAIIEAMCEHKDLDEVQEKGCWALGALVKAHSENKIQAGDAGACEAVCEALRCYSGQEGLQQVGLWAMGSLAAVSHLAKRTSRVLV